MPHETIIEENGIYWRIYGILSYGEFFLINKETWNRSDWSDMKYQITNFLDVDTVEISKEKVTLIAHMDSASSQSSHKMKVALVADQDDILELCTDYIEALKPGDWEAKIFGTLEEARAWVG